MIHKLIALPYEIARTPFVVADTKISQLLPETSRPRVTLDRAIATADNLVGALLHDSEIKRRGAERTKQSDARIAAERLETQASDLRAEARATAERGQRTAASRRAAAQEHAATGLATADAVEADRKKAARVDAQKTAARKKKAAAKKAATRSTAVQQTRKRTESAAGAKKTAARKRAAVQHEDASEASAAATTARKDADRLDDLVDTKKEERSSSDS